MIQLIVLILVGIYINTFIKDTFVAYNSFEIKQDKNTNEQLNFLFKNTESIPDTSTFFEHPYYIKFEPTFDFEASLIQALTPSFPKETIIEWIRDPYNIFWKDTPIGRQFVFNIDLNIKQIPLFAKLQVYLLVNKNNTIHIKNINVKDITKDITFDSLQPQDNIYRIKNTLYLMDPFLTSAFDGKF
jgi:hypothetical protein